MPTLRIAKDLFDFLHPIGTYYETSNANWTPQGAGWYGTWTREDDGTALVSYKSSGAFNKSIGTVVGEETHKLTTDEMPRHRHNLDDPYYKFAELQWGLEGETFKGDKWQDHTRYTSWEGSDQPHNNVQPSKVVYRWHRTA